MYFFGIVSGLMIALAFALYADDNHDRREGFRDKVITICASLNSEPYSYDEFKVTCKNKAIINYNDYEELKENNNE